MKYLIQLVLLVSPFLSWGQEKDTKSIFSYEKLTFSSNDFTVIDHYISLDNNINNQNSPFFISKKPTSQQILQSAFGTISDSFIVTKNNIPVYAILVGVSPYKNIVAVNLKTKQQTTFPSNFKGDITANRAIEIISNGYDSKGGGIVDGKLHFNNQVFGIISNEDIKTRIISILEELHAAAQ